MDLGKFFYAYIYKIFTYSYGEIFIASKHYRYYVFIIAEFKLACFENFLVQPIHVITISHL